MKKVIQYSLLLIFFTLCLYLFIPKKGLYYQFEKLIAPQEIIISNEELIENLFSLEVKNGKLYIKDMYLTTLSFIIKSYLINNSIEFKSFQIGDDFIAFFPKNIEKIRIDYSLFSPKIVKLEAKGDFGEAKGYINLFKKSLYFDVNISKLLKTRYKNILHELKKDKKGGYFYEYKY